VLLILAVSVLIGKPVDASAQDEKRQQIGFIIATKGSATISSKAALPRPATLRQEIYRDDVVRTGLNSAAKILFDDNTMLSMTENTEIAVNQYAADSSGKRTTVLRMARGRVKAELGEIYDAGGSRFEIQTPTAIAAARATDYVVWTTLQKGRPVTGVAVLAGTVAVTNAAGQSVTLAPGFYSLAAADAPISTPAPVAKDPQIQQLVQESDVRTDPSVLPQVKIAKQAQAVPPSGAPVSELAAAERIPGEQWVWLGSGGLGGRDRTGMGTTNFPCTFVSGSGFQPLGCTARPGIDGFR
jgi:hypothetical protein